MSSSDSSQDSTSSIVCKIRNIKARTDGEKMAMLEELKCLRAKNTIMESKLFELESKIKVDSEINKIQVRKLKNLLQVSQYDNNKSSETISSLIAVEATLKLEVSQLQQQLHEAVAVNEEVLAELEDFAMLDEALVDATTNETKVKIESEPLVAIPLLPPVATVSPTAFCIKRPLDCSSTDGDSSASASPLTVKKQRFSLDASLITDKQAKNSETVAVITPAARPQLTAEQRLIVERFGQSVNVSSLKSELLPVAKAPVTTSIAAPVDSESPPPVAIATAKPSDGSVSPSATVSSGSSRLRSQCFYLSITTDDAVQLEALQCIAEQCQVNGQY